MRTSDQKCPEVLALLNNKIYPGKHQHRTQNHYLDTVGNTVAYNFIKTISTHTHTHTNVLQETPKNEIADTLKSHYK